MYITDKFCLKKSKVYSTRYSQAVTHPSTNRARRCLTSVIGREPVYSTWYGRRHWKMAHKPIYVCAFHIRQEVTTGSDTRAGVGLFSQTKSTLRVLK